MRNYRQSANTVTVVSPIGGVSSGDVVVIGSLIGVATASAVAGADLEFALTGAYLLPKATGGGSAIAAGARLWWDGTLKVAKNASAAGL
jgi:predicted RecA/RadA family phage recombinase